MRDPVDLALGEAQVLARARVPSDFGHELAVQARRKGNAITITESRPPWNPGRADAVWTTLEVARLRFDPSRSVWTLFYRDRAERWRLYDGLPPSATVDALLGEIDADPTGIFWG